MDFRLKKQLTVLVVVIVIAMVGALIFKQATAPPEPTCFDNIQNQGEVDIDCGGPCAPCATQPEAIVLSGAPELVIAEALKIDVIFLLRNPNANFGASRIPYTLEIFDAQQQLIGTRSGTTFLAPREERFIIENAVDVSGKAAWRVAVVLGEASWARTPVGQSLNDQLEVVNQELERNLQGPEFAEVRGIVQNRSPFEYARVAVNVIVRDREGNLVALRATDVRNLRALERRAFRVAWRVVLPEAGEVTVDAFTNLFLNENFVREHRIAPFKAPSGVQDFFEFEEQ